MEELHYWIGLASITGAGPRRIKKLLDVFGSPREIFAASEESLCSVEGMDAPTAAAIAAGMDWDFARSQAELAEKEGARIVTLQDGQYPKLLREIADPPAVLYVRGQILPQDERAIAVVGTRKATPYGKSATESIVQELAAGGITIVSGMARGIDSIAHHACLKAGGRTIAVLGCGVDVCYPPENGELMEAIAQNGFLISEFPMGMQPDTFTFPKRNRLISGLSHGVCIMEAGEGSGALITADFAVEQGRDVFALPGQVHDRSFAGCHRLIQQGAGLITCGREVLDQLQRPLRLWGAARPVAQPNLSEEEESVYHHLSYDPMHIDTLAQKCGRPPSTVLGILLGMELRGTIQQLAGKNFVKA